MPTPQSKDTNQYRCSSCGRYFNTHGELSEHEKQCAAAQQSGQTGKKKVEPGREEGEDREWVSTP